MNKSDEQIKKIKIAKGLRERGYTFREIGEKMNLSKQRIHQLIQGEYFNESELKFIKRIRENFEIEDVLKRGFPDFLIVSKDGKMCAVEVKKGKRDRLSIYQKKAYLYLNAGGIPTFVSIDGELSKDIINFFKEGKGNQNIIEVFEKFEKKYQIEKLKKEREIIIRRAKVIKFLAKEFSAKDISIALQIKYPVVVKIIKNPIPVPYNKKIIEHDR